METFYVWVTTRRLPPGTLDDFEHAWRPEQRPDGLQRAFAYWSADGREVTGVSFWDSKDSCDRWRAGDAEARRREAMAPYVEKETEAFYEGRELGLPEG
jgi:heme-degrading monooxygenase HmoA